MKISGIESSKSDYRDDGKDGPAEAEEQEAEEESRGALSFFYLSSYLVVRSAHVQITGSLHPPVGRTEQGKDGR